MKVPGVILTLTAIVTVWSVHTATSNQPDTPTTSTPRSAEDIFLSDCAVCHGPRARGTKRAPSLEGVGRAAVDFMLSTGRMPLDSPGRNTEPGRAITPQPGIYQSDPKATPSRHDPAYSPANIAGLVDYVGELSGPGPDIPTVQPGDIAMGGTLYRRQCAACHAWAGDGGALFRREAPALHQATPVQIAEAIRIGPGNMPKFGTAALDETQLYDVVAYVRYLSAPNDRGGLPLGHLGPVAEGALALVAIGGLLVFLRWVGERG